MLIPAKAGIYTAQEVLDCPVKPDNDKLFLGYNISCIHLRRTG
jgi:hypothetical protein